MKNILIGASSDMYKPNEPSMASLPLRIILTLEMETMSELVRLRYIIVVSLLLKLMPICVCLRRRQFM